jgi:hypothetical protein
MEAIGKDVLARMPLAQAVLWLWRHVTAGERLQLIWQRFRGRNYDKLILFPTLVGLISDALLQYGSGRRSFEKGFEAGILPASFQAAYGKLGRLPISVSEALLKELTASLREMFPAWSTWALPKSLARFQVLVYDGKAIKRVAKRMKALRGIPGGVLGGRALVAIDWSTGLAVGMQGHPDGEINDVRLLKDLTDQVYECTAGPRLFVMDRAFCDLKQPGYLTRSPGDRFLVRYHPKVSFHRDFSRPQRSGVDERGRPYTESWGSLGSPLHPQRQISVRRIELPLSQTEMLVLITDLIDADEFPAIDLLWIYAQRWDIERVFQQVTEVFGLDHLIGSTPQGSLFQFAFCLVLYNMIQIIRAYIAEAQDKEPSGISTEKLFDDVKRELTAWTVIVDPEQTQQHFDELPKPPDLRKLLARLLKNCWSETWIASAPQAVHRRSPKKRGRTHNSAYRILAAAKLAGKHPTPRRC